MLWSSLFVVHRKCTCTTKQTGFMWMGLCIVCICLHLAACFCIFFMKIKLWSNWKHFMAFLTNGSSTGCSCVFVQNVFYTYTIYTYKMHGNGTMAKATFIAFLCTQSNQSNWIQVFRIQSIREIVCHLINFKWCSNASVCLFLCMSI